MTERKLPLKGDGTSRDQEIQRAVRQHDEKIVRDVIILQKVNKAHRDAFKEKFPGQLEHCMRLTAERLQALLTKKPSDLTDVDTWTGKPDEILALSHGLYYLSIMNQHYPVPESD